MRLQLKRSNVLASGSAKTPTASQLEYGELAINYNTDDPAIFLKDSNNNVIRISGVGNIADDGQVELPATTTPPSNPQSGNLWYNSDDGRLYIYYTDADSSQWVDASPDSWDPTVLPDTTNSNSQSGTLDDRYLMLNSGNDPVTGGLNITGGNVGIGTTSPGDELSIVDTSGSAGTSITAAGNAFLVLDSNVGGTSGNQLSFIDFKSNGTVKGNISLNEGVTGQPLELNSATSNDVVVAAGGGNVGIGVASGPSEKLEVAGNVNVIGGGNLLMQTGARVQFGTSDAASVIGEHGSSGYLALAANNEHMRILANGNIGVGTSAPSMLLDVRGASNPQIKVSATNTGTNSAGLYIENQGQRNWQIWADRSSDQLRIGHNNRASTVLTITDSRVGIGETNPGNKLVVRGNAVFGPDNTTAQYQGISLQNGKDSSAGIATGFIDFRNNLDVADTHIFADHNTDGSSTIILGTTPAGARNSDRRSEKMRITGNGNVGIGTSNPSTKVEISDSSPALRLSDSATIGTSGRKAGAIEFYQNDASGGAGIGSSITAYHVNQSGNLDLRFQAGNDTERMRITSSGNLLIHQSSSSVPGSGNTTEGACFEKAADGSTLFVSRGANASAIFNRNSAGNTVIFNRSGNQHGRIVVNSNGTVSYLNNSDYRVKENVVVLDNAIDRVKQLLPKRFNFIADADITVDGFLAHEAQTVVPEAVEGTHNEVDDDGNPVMQGIDQSKLVPLLTAALQEAITRIEALENA